MPLWASTCVPGDPKVACRAGGAGAAAAAPQGGALLASAWKTETNTGRSCLEHLRWLAVRWKASEFPRAPGSARVGAEGMHLVAAPLQVSAAPPTTGVVQTPVSAGSSQATARAHVTLGSTGDALAEASSRKPPPAAATAAAAPELYRKACVSTRLARSPLGAAAAVGCVVLKAFLVPLRPSPTP